LMVIAEKMFRDEEFAEPYEILKAAGHRITVASSSPGVAEGKLGMKVKPDTTLDAVDPSAYDAIVIAGGPGAPKYLADSAPLHRALREVYGKGGVIAAICIAPITLTRAGLLKGRKATVFPDEGARDEMERGGCSLQGDHVVVDGRIVTADGPKAAKEFGEAVRKLLARG